MSQVRFIRTLGIKQIHHLARRRYGIDAQGLHIPESAFENDMTLLPLSEVNRWYEEVEKRTGNPDIMLELSRELDLERVGAISRWFLSGSDLASTFRRINYGLSSLQSGAYLSGSQSGSILKWIYHNPYIEPQCKVHDSIRVAVFMTKILRVYLGEDFSPMRVLISGTRKNSAKYESYFGCTVEWSQPKTEIWFHADLRLATRQKTQFSQRRLAMNFSDLDEFLNMPEPDDEVKVIYEVINYSRHYGLPTLERVSGLLGLSTQQFQRKLHGFGMNFTTVLGYVLSNTAVTLLGKGVSVEEVAQRLGYQNCASFNRMFKKHRGLTPKQYIQHFHDTF
ncbi:AraC family transcriptional regulator [Vibrio aquaticus]|uniref:AraC family transcriptional regulator n=1 Tax=Vibrio aquaticus TaxID=2496559 RepID=A0A432D173_9VIBR|nr:AraC family transcriptional regulator [Vibrio aquaticus]RTZ17647.1 AraC family transcriptional regulator [Vibrio aquaticus]